MKSKDIRPLYEQLGVDNYYKNYAHQYTNPHAEQIQQLLIQNESRLDYSRVLDFCAGGGEVSAVLQTLGYADFAASDPFTYQLYEKKLQRHCYRWSFDDAVRGKLEGDYTTIVASFALHLCDENQLFTLAYQLFQHTPKLVVITPHKRPELEQYEGIILDFEDFALTDKGKKVFLKTYSSTF